MGLPHCLRPNNGGEFTSRSNVHYFDSVGIRCEYPAAAKHQQKAVLETVIWGAMKGGHVARREMRQLFQGVDFARIPNIDANANSLWLEDILWAVDCFNRSATKANTGWQTPHEVIVSGLLDLQVVPFFWGGMMRLDHRTKSGVQSVMCYFLSNDHNRPSSTAKMIKA